MKYQENILAFKDYVDLRESVGWNNYEKEQTVHALAHSLYKITAVEDQQAVGMGRLLGDGLYYLVVDVVVRPEYQGKGIGSGIIKKILTYVELQTPIQGRASVQLIAEEGKEAFYERMGFKRIPHVNCGTGMRKVIYKGGGDNMGEKEKPLF